MQEIILESRYHEDTHVSRSARLRDSLSEQ